jgi:acyl dehydratase
MTVTYLEDFVAGQRFSSGRMVVEREHIERFASEFDPQPFHLDEKAAKTRSSVGSRRAGGTPRRSRCVSWSTAI